MLVRITALLPLLMLSTLPASGQVLLDYSEVPLDVADTDQWSPIANELGGGVVVLGEVRGAFTAAGAEEVAYLVSNGSPVAADPFPELEQRIVVYAGDEQVADWPIADGAFTRPVTAVDIDGDGISEVLAETSFYNMGTMAIGLGVIKVGEDTEIVQTLNDVYVDSCEAGMGEKAIIAGVVSILDGQLVTEARTLDCL